MYLRKELLKSESNRATRFTDLQVQGHIEKLVDEKRKKLGQLNKKKPKNPEAEGEDDEEALVEQQKLV